MTCDEIRDLLELYALGVLEPDEHLAVREHLASRCDVCQANLQRATLLNAAVLQAAPEAQPSSGLRNRVLASVRPAEARRQPWGWMGLAASLAAGFAWVVVDSQRKDAQLTTLRTQRDDSDREAARLNTALSFLRDPQTRPANATTPAAQPRGTYFVSPKGVLLIASNLPALRPDQTYEMWVIPKGQNPSPAGLFRPDSGGGAVHFVPRDVDLPSTQALAITVEPESGSPAPTTTPMLVTPVAGL